MNPLSSELPFHVHNWLIISLKDFCIVIRKWPTFWPSTYKLCYDQLLTKSAELSALPIDRVAVACQLIFPQKTCTTDGVPSKITTAVNINRRLITFSRSIITIECHWLIIQKIIKLCKIIFDDFTDVK